MHVAPAERPIPDGGIVGILTSGGDAPGMNTAIRAAVKMCRARGFTTLGVQNGYRGLLDGRHRELQTHDVDGIERVGGTMLGTARSADFPTEAGQVAAKRNVLAMGLDALIVIGGNGSLAGARLLAQHRTARGEQLRVVGVPASIDNDIGYTSMSIGVDTALNTIVETCDRISDTAASHQRAFLVEVMGRDCGYLAMAAAVACGADGVLYRESGLGDDELVEQVVQIIENAFGRQPPRARVLILKAEGVKIPLDTLKQRVDHTLAERGSTAETRVTVLGHVVRGGAPTAADRLISGRLARAAAWAAIEGYSDVMIGWQSRAVFDGHGVASTHDPYCAIVPLEDALAETRALLDGSSPVVKWRIRALAEFEELAKV